MKLEGIAAVMPPMFENPATVARVSATLPGFPVIAVIANALGLADARAVTAL